MKVLHGMVVVIAGLGLLTSCSQRSVPEYHMPEGISWASVLTNCSDINAVAEPVQNWEQTLFFSSSASTSKVMLANLAPQIMGDMDHGFFLDVVEHADGVDATLAEIYGQGMITWIWSANPSGTLRLFLDDVSTPTIEMPFRDFMAGKILPVKYPFSSITAKGHNFEFPILHENYCKLVVRVPQKKDLASLYYQVAWNSVSPTQAVKRFAVEDVSTGSTVLRRVAQAMLKPRGEKDFETLTTVELLAGQPMDLFWSNEEGTLTEILLETETRAEMAQLQFRAYWDDSAQPSIDCPLYLLAGASGHLEHVQSLPVSINGSTLSIRWPMSFRTARLVVENTSPSPMIRLAYKVTMQRKSGLTRFAGQYMNYEGLRTDLRNILTLAEIEGAGRIVACNLQVKSRTEKWWGEGDPHIYLDSRAEPTWQGTGTEDYFGFAWCAEDAFEHPFRGQSAISENESERTTAMYRYHLMDRLPFHKTALYQIEACGLGEGTMDYESVILYYTEGNDTIDISGGASGRSGFH